MTLTVYSVGDYSFLQEIFNSVAMLFSYGAGGSATHITGAIGGMVASGLMLGLLGTAFRCLMGGGGKFEIHHVLIGLFLVLCFFNPAITAKVVVEDYYTGATKEVDNVPLGPAVTGFLVSHLGKGINDLFGQAYSSIDTPMSQSNGYLEALRVLHSVRRASRDVSVLAALNTSASEDVETSFLNYFAECTMTKIQLGMTTAEKIYAGGLSELEFNSSMHGTEVLLDDAKSSEGETTLTCARAWPYLSARIAKASATEAILGRINSLAGVWNADGTENQTIDRIQSAENMLKLSAMDAQGFIQLSVLEPIYRKAASRYYATLGDVSSSIMINQSIAQRNTQWAAEQSMFYSVMRPLMAFFEAFVYAASPLIAFFVVLGPMGLSLAVKYVQMALWLVLWYPVLSITNLFILSAAGKTLQAMFSGVTSFYAINSADQIVDNWLAVGGMLTAATPLIALFLITGSTYAFTTLTSRMAGSDHVSEQITTPNLVQQGAVLGMSNVRSYESAPGVALRAGGKAMASTIDVSRSAEETVRTAQSHQETAMRSLTAATGQAISAGMQGSNVLAASQQIGDYLQASHPEQFQTRLSEAHRAGFSTRSTGMTNSQLVGMVSASGSAGLSVGALSRILPVHGGLGGSGSRSDTWSLGTGADRSNSESTDRAATTSSAATLDEGRRWNGSDSRSVSQAGTWNKELDDRLGKAIQTAQRSTQEFSRAQSLASRIGVGQKADIPSLAGMFMGRRDVMAGHAKAWTAMRNYGMDNQSVRDYTSRIGFYQSLGMEPQEAIAAAQIETMSRSAEHRGDFLENYATLTGNRPSDPKLGKAVAPVTLAGAEKAAIGAAGNLSFGSAADAAAAQQAANGGLLPKGSFGSQRWTARRESGGVPVAHGDYMQRTQMDAAGMQEQVERTDLAKAMDTLGGVHKMSNPGIANILTGGKLLDGLRVSEKDLSEVRRETAGLALTNVDRMVLAAARSGTNLIKGEAATRLRNMEISQIMATHLNPDGTAYTWDQAWKAARQRLDIMQVAASAGGRVAAANLAAISATNIASGTMEKVRDFGTEKMSDRQLAEFLRANP